jgi:histidinol-phosphate aminotransferase
MNFILNNIIRENILQLKPYSSARDEYEGAAEVFLDANENSMGSALGGNLNRYPDPYQKSLKQKVSLLKNVPAENIFVGNGSDEPIDLLIRAACTPGKDNIIICPPTYGMYEVSANINDVALRRVLLTAEFQLNTSTVLEAVSNHTKIIFICSPNNPTGNLINSTDIQLLLENFNGLVVVDEAYIDFANTPSWSRSLSQYPNLVVLQTFSKAWGLAGLRVGLCFASAAIIAILNKIKPPYNMNLLSQQKAAEALAQEAQVRAWVNTIECEKALLQAALPQLNCVKKIYDSQANFLLVRVSDAVSLYNYLSAKGIVVRNRHGVPLCGNCLRITVGTPIENKLLLEALREFENLKIS